MIGRLNQHISTLMGDLHGHPPHLIVYHELFAEKIGWFTCMDLPLQALKYALVTSLHTAHKFHVGNDVCYTSMPT